MLASLLPTGAVAGLSYAQVLYTLPVSLFGMSVSAAELPTMAGAIGTEAERAAFLRERLGAGLRQIAFFVVPSAMAFLALGDVVAGALYQSGAFTREMTVYVWGILAGSAVGLLASTMGRLYASTYYALHDTRTPLRFALVRVALTIGLGYLAALPLPRAAGHRCALGRGRAHGVGRARRLGGVRCCCAARSTARIGTTGLPVALTARLWGAAAAGAGAAWGASGAAADQRGRSSAPLLLLTVYGGVYFLLTDRLGIPEAAAVTRRLRPREPRGGPAG